MPLLLRKALKQGYNSSDLTSLTHLAFGFLGKWKVLILI